MFGVNSAAHAAFRSAKNFGRCRTKHRDRVPKLRLFPAPPLKYTHLHPHHFFTPTISKHPDELGLDCVKTRAWQEPELGDFLARPVVARPDRKAIIASSHEALH